MYAIPVEAITVASDSESSLPESVSSSAVAVVVVLVGAVGGVVGFGLGSVGTAMHAFVDGSRDVPVAQIVKHDPANISYPVEHPVHYPSVVPTHPVQPDAHREQ